MKKQHSEKPPERLLICGSRFTMAESSRLHSGPKLRTLYSDFPVLVSASALLRREQPDNHLIAPIVIAEGNLISQGIVGMALSWRKFQWSGFGGLALTKFPLTSQDHQACCRIKGPEVECPQTSGLNPRLTGIQAGPRFPMLHMSRSLGSASTSSGNINNQTSKGHGSSGSEIPNRLEPFLLDCSHYPTLLVVQVGSCPFCPEIAGVLQIYRMIAMLYSQSYAVVKQGGMTALSPDVEWPDSGHGTILQVSSRHIMSSSLNWIQVSFQNPQMISVWKGKSLPQQSGGSCYSSVRRAAANSVSTCPSRIPHPTGRFPEPSSGREPDSRGLRPEECIGKPNSARFKLAFHAHSHSAVKPWQNWRHCNYSYGSRLPEGGSHLLSTGPNWVGHIECRLRNPAKEWFMHRKNRSPGTTIWVLWWNFCSLPQ